MAEGEAERVLVRLGAAVDQEGAGEPGRPEAHQPLGGPGADGERHRVALEEQLLRLGAERRHQPRMPVAEQRHGVAAVEVDQRAAVARMDDRPLAPDGLDGGVRVDGQQPAGLVQLGLENGFDGGLSHVNLLYSHPSPGTVNPAVSGNPNSRFIHWIAPPAAPFTRLSIAEKTTR